MRHPQWQELTIADVLQDEQACQSARRFCQQTSRYFTNRTDTKPNYKRFVQFSTVLIF
jgi:hypothetical protein